MKIDIDKNHPFTSVCLISEDKKDEYWSEEQTAEFKRVGLRCIRFGYLSAFFAVFAFICEFVDLYDLFSASNAERILAIIGYVGLSGLILSLIFVFIDGRKLQKLSREFNDGNRH